MNEAMKSWSWGEHKLIAKHKIGFAPAVRWVIMYLLSAFEMLDTVMACRWM